MRGMSREWVSVASAGRQQCDRLSATRGRRARSHAQQSQQPCVLIDNMAGSHEPHDPQELVTAQDFDSWPTYTASRILSNGPKAPERRGCLVEAWKHG
eukprot:15218339-Alexandrium_andersonii.AAC.1